MNIKHGIVIAVCAIITASSCNNNKMIFNNPLLQLSNNKFESPQFDLIETAHFKPAFEEAIARGRGEIESITQDSEEANFKNTIERLEFAGDDLTNVSAIFFNLNEANTSELMQEIALEVSPLLSDYSNDIMLNEKLFQRVKKVYDKRALLNLTPEELRLTEECYKGFARNGANLEGEMRDEFRIISKELSQLTLKFGQNVLAATNKFYLHITDSTMMEGLPRYVADAGAEEAQERSLEGWVFTLHAPSYGPFMQYCSIRELREKMWLAYNSKALYDEFDNRDIIKRIVELRLKKANLLGYSTHAHYVLENNMAATPQNVNTFLEDLLNKTLPFAKRELGEIQAYASQNGFPHNIMPWDFAFWSEKYKSEKYSVNDQILKPYFRLESVERAVFSLADSLFGLKFVKNDTIPVYHSDVKVFEVYDDNGSLISLLYLDYFPRESKRGGAWMTSFREQSIRAGKERRPFVSLVCNFTKPTAEMPSLLTFNEVTTLLHEFGHALHGMLALGTYPSLTGTNVVRDFVELPSQIMENWATEGEFLKSFAVHYQTGETIPDDIIEKIVKSRNFLSGYSNVRQLTFGLNDMAWHNIESAAVIDDVVEFEKRAVSRAKIFPEVDSVSISASFSHIFSGGYSAGYYSYKWAEVLEADAFSLFKERGVFCREVATSFRDNILSKGNLEDAATLYRKFRGRDPRADALLEKSGLTTLYPSPQ